MSANEIPDAIQWHEGMLLAPQHYQQWSLRHEALLHYHVSAGVPFYWGIRHWPLKVDPALLGRGTLRVSELEAVMPDGLLISHGLHEADDLEVDLTPHVEEMKKRPLPVHLAVPVRKPVPVKGDLPRVRSYEGNPVPDENTGDNEIRIPRLRPCVSLLVTESPPQKYVTFPLVKVRYVNETFALTDFISPCLATPLRSPLGDMCSRVVKRLREKAVFLSEQARAPSSTMGMPLTLEKKNAIHALVAALPHFEAVLNTGVSHPYAVYLALCSLVGHLAALGESLLPPDLKPYDHHDLRATFEPVVEFAHRMFDEGIPETYRAFPFNLDQGMFGLRFDGSWMSRRLVLAVRGQPGMSERDVASWVDTALIGSSKRIPSMRDRRVLGPVRERIERDDELVPTRGVVLFTLKPDPEFLEPNEMLQIVNTGDRVATLRPAEIVLRVKNAP